jgi:dTDP-4-amino-4,6-dideoxygalactose transaminase
MKEIPFLSLRSAHDQIKEEVMSEFERLFDDGSFILSSRVKSFEESYSEFNRVDHVIGVSNGLDALHIALRALGISAGDEVLVPSNTYIASALAVSYVGARPVFVEPDQRTYNVTAKAFEEAITPRTKAIMPVHLYGQACEMSAIMDVARSKSLWVVEDNAQAHGASWEGRLTGSWGHINGTSFYPGKNLGALGDAGAVTTNSRELAGKAKLFRNYGSERKYHHDVIGYNMRLDECQAAFLTIKLKYINIWTKQRQQIAEWYMSALRNLGDLLLPVTKTGATHVYHLFVVRTKKRNELQNYLTSLGVGTLIHYPVPPHLQLAYQDLTYRKGSLPVAEELAETVLSLPLWPGMTEQQVEFVADSIKKFFH